MKMDDPLLTAYALGELRDEALIQEIEDRISREPELLEEIEVIRALGAQISDAFDLENGLNPSIEEATESKVIPFTREENSGSEPLRRAKIARLTEAAPELKDTGRFSYGSLIAALVATVALAGIFSFNHFSETIQEQNKESRLVQVEPLDPSDSIEATTLAERIDQQLAAEKASADAALEAMTLSMSEEQRVPVNSNAASRFSDDADEAERISRLRSTAIAEQEVTDDLKDLLVDKTAQAEEPKKTALPETNRNENHVAVPALARDYNQATAKAMAQASREISEKGVRASSLEASSDTESSFYLHSNSFAEIDASIPDTHLSDPSRLKIGKLLNRFSFGQESDEGGENPFKIDFEVVQAPWNPRHDLMRITVRGLNHEWDQRPGTHWVFIVENTASMAASDRSPIVKAGLGQIVRRLDQRDYVTLIVADSGTETLLKAVPGNEHERILEGIEGVKAKTDIPVMDFPKALKRAYASTIEGVQTHYILCVDGAFDSDDWRAVFDQVETGSANGNQLNVFRFGRNRSADGPLNQLAEIGHGKFEMIETINDANRRFVEVASRRTMVMAKDLTMELKLNEIFVRGYRLIGFDDERLPGELAALSNTVDSGYSVTTLYELVPHRPTGYQEALTAQFVPVVADPKMPEDVYVSLNVEYRDPVDSSRRQADYARLASRIPRWENASVDMRWSSALAAFGLILREGKTSNGVDLELVEQLAQSALSGDKTGDRQRFLELVQRVRKK